MSQVIEKLLEEDIRDDDYYLHRIIILGIMEEYYDDFVEDIDKSLENLIDEPDRKLKDFKKSVYINFYKAASEKVKKAFREDDLDNFIG